MENEFIIVILGKGSSYNTPADKENKMFTKQRLNVALSRAKNKLIIIGDSNELI